MKKILFKFNDLEIELDDERYYAVYDAGAHQIVMRRDPITEEEAKLACSGPEGATEMLFSLQRRLIEAGFDPYRSNIGDQNREVAGFDRSSLDVPNRMD
jgi:hypothetical protein